MKQNKLIKKMIIEKAHEIIKNDFMQYPEEVDKLNLKGALTVILSEHLTDLNSSYIYEFLNAKIK